MTTIAATHDALRPLMFSIAYRMLGSVSDAEDVVQEAFLRMHRAERDGLAIESPDAYATTVTTRLAIDALRSARARRERYVGSWLPEPWLIDDDDPARRAEADETLSSAFLVVLETLTPVERAVFLLREVFGHSYAEIAAIVERTEAACRQQMARARRRLAERRTQFDAPEHAVELAERFFAACREGDVEALERLLAEDVAFVGDGGGKAPAARQPVLGALQVARFVAGLGRLAVKTSMSIRVAAVNGQPGAVVSAAEGIVGVLTLDVRDGRVQLVHNVMNPDKLRHLGPVADVNALLGAGR